MSTSHGRHEHPVPPKGSSTSTPTPSSSSPPSALVPSSLLVSSPFGMPSMSGTSSHIDPDDTSKTLTATSADSTSTSIPATQIPATPLSSGSDNETRNDGQDNHTPHGSTPTSLPESFDSLDFNFVGIFRHASGSFSGGTAGTAADHGSEQGDEHLHGDNATTNNTNSHPDASQSHDDISIDNNISVHRSTAVSPSPAVVHSQFPLDGDHSSSSMDRLLQVTPSQFDEAIERFTVGSLDALGGFDMLPTTSIAFPPQDSAAGPVKSSQQQQQRRQHSTAKDEPGGLPHTPRKREVVSQQPAGHQPPAPIPPMGVTTPPPTTTAIAMPESVLRPPRMVTPPRAAVAQTPARQDAEPDGGLPPSMPLSFDPDAVSSPHPAGGAGATAQQTTYPATQLFSQVATPNARLGDSLRYTQVMDTNYVSDDSELEDGVYHVPCLGTACDHRNCDRAEAIRKQKLVEQRALEAMWAYRQQVINPSVAVSDIMSSVDEGIDAKPSLTPPEVPPSPQATSAQGKLSQLKAEPASPTARAPAASDAAPLVSSLNTTMHDGDSGGDNNNNDTNNNGNDAAITSHTMEAALLREMPSILPTQSQDALKTSQAAPTASPQLASQKSQGQAAQPSSHPKVVTFSMDDVDCRDLSPPASPSPPRPHQSEDAAGVDTAPMMMINAAITRHTSMAPGAHLQRLQPHSGSKTPPTSPPMSSAAHPRRAHSTPETTQHRASTTTAKPFHLTPHQSSPATQATRPPPRRLLTRKPIHFSLDSQSMASGDDATSHGDDVKSTDGSADGSVTSYITYDDPDSLETDQEMETPKRKKVPRSQAVGGGEKQTQPRGQSSSIRPHTRSSRRRSLHSQYSSQDYSDDDHGDNNDSHDDNDDDDDDDEAVAVISTLPHVHSLSPTNNPRKTMPGRARPASLVTTMKMKLSQHAVKPTSPMPLPALGAGENGEASEPQQQGQMGDGSSDNDDGDDDGDILIVDTNSGATPSTRKTADTMLTTLIRKASLSPKTRKSMTRVHRRVTLQQLQQQQQPSGSTTISSSTRGKPTSQRGAPRSRGKAVHHTSSTSNSSTSGDDDDDNDNDNNDNDNDDEEWQPSPKASPARRSAKPRRQRGSTTRGKASRAKVVKKPQAGGKKTPAATPALTTADTTPPPVHAATPVKLRSVVLDKNKPLSVVDPRRLARVNAEMEALERQHQHHRYTVEDTTTPYASVDAIVTTILSLSQSLSQQQQQDPPAGDTGFQRGYDSHQGGMATNNHHHHHHTPDADADTAHPVGLPQHILDALYQIHGFIHQEQLGLHTLLLLTQLIMSLTYRGEAARAAMAPLLALTGGMTPSFQPATAQQYFMPPQQSAVTTTPGAAAVAASLTPTTQGVNHRHMDGNAGIATEQGQGPSSVGRFPHRNSSPSLVSPDRQSQQYRMHQQRQQQKDGHEANGLFFDELGNDDDDDDEDDNDEDDHEMHGDDNSKLHSTIGDASIDVPEVSSASSLFTPEKSTRNITQHLITQQTPHTPQVQGASAVATHSPVSTRSRRRRKAMDALVQSSKETDPSPGNSSTRRPPAPSVMSFAAYQKQHHGQHKSPFQRVVAHHGHGDNGDGDSDNGDGDSGDSDAVSNPLHQTPQQPPVNKRKRSQMATSDATTTPGVQSMPVTTAKDNLHRSTPHPHGVIATTPSAAKTSGSTIDLTTPLAARQQRRHGVTTTTAPIPPATPVVPLHIQDVRAMVSMPPRSDRPKLIFSPLTMDSILASFGITSTTHLPPHLPSILPHYFAADRHPVPELTSLKFPRLFDPCIAEITPSPHVFVPLPGSIMALNPRLAHPPAAAAAVHPQHNGVDDGAHQLTSTPSMSLIDTRRLRFLVTGTQDAQEKRLLAATLSVLFPGSLIVDGVPLLYPEVFIRDGVVLHTLYTTAVATTTTQVEAEPYIDIIIAYHFSRTLKLLLAKAQKTQLLHPRHIAECFTLFTQLIDTAAAASPSPSPPSSFMPPTLALTQGTASSDSRGSAGPPSKRKAKHGKDTGHTNAKPPLPTPASTSTSTSPSVLSHDGDDVSHGGVFNTTGYETMLLTVGRSQPAHHSGVDGSGGSSGAVGSSSATRDAAHHHRRKTISTRRSAVAGSSVSSFGGFYDLYGGPITTTAGGAPVSPGDSPPALMDLLTASQLKLLDRLAETSSTSVSPGPSMRQQQLQQRPHRLYLPPSLVPAEKSTRPLFGIQVFLLGPLAQRREWAGLLAAAGAVVLNTDIPPLPAVAGGGGGSGTVSHCTNIAAHMQLAHVVVHSDNDGDTEGQSEQHHHHTEGMHAYCQCECSCTATATGASRTTPSSRGTTSSSSSPAATRPPPPPPPWCQTCLVDQYNNELDCVQFLLSSLHVVYTPEDDGDAATTTTTTAKKKTKTKSSTASGSSSRTSTSPTTRENPAYLQLFGPLVESITPPQPCCAVSVYGGSGDGSHSHQHPSTPTPLNHPTKRGRREIFPSGSDASVLRYESFFQAKRPSAVQQFYEAHDLPPCGCRTLEKHQRRCREEPFTLSNHSRIGRTVLLSLRHCAYSPLYQHILDLSTSTHPRLVTPTWATTVIDASSMSSPITHAQVPAPPSYCTYCKHD